MFHEVRLVRGLVAIASEALVKSPPVDGPGERMVFQDPPPKFVQMHTRRLDMVRRRFLSVSLRWLFSEPGGSNAIVVLSYAKSSVIMKRKATRHGQRIRYGMDSGGPFKRVTSWRKAPPRRETVSRISFDELIFSSRDPEEAYRSVCALIVEGAARILGPEEVRRIINSEKRSVLPLLPR